MKKAKKVFAAFLAAAMAASMLAGCGGSGSSDSSSSSTGSDTTTSGNASSDSSDDAQADSSVTTTSVGEYTEDDPYHLTFAYIEFYTQDESARQAVQDALNEYTIPKYHIEVEFLPLSYADYQQTIQLMISGGDDLDVMPIYFPYASSWINMNGVVDMNQFMDSADGQAIIDTLGEANAYVGSMNGVLYGFPAQKESVDIGGLCMRADICDALGITEEYGLGSNQDEYTGKVYDWSVATEIFEKVHEAYPDMTVLYQQGSATNINRLGWFDPLADNFGVLEWEKDHETTEVVNFYETETFRNSATLLAEWYDAGYIYQDALTDTQGAATMMKAGNTFSYITSIKPGFLTEANAANGTECYAMYFGNQIEGGYSTTNVCFFNTGIATNSTDPEMAFKFITALYTDATVMNIWQYGIEDVNYQVLDDGTAYFVDGEDSSNYAYHQNTGWCMGNQFNSYVWNDGTKSTDYWQELSDYNKWASYSPAYGFLWDSTDYSTEMTALTNALNTYLPALTCGSVGTAGLDETIDALNEALYAAGLQKVMDAKQEQLNAWLEANGGITQTPQENIDLINSAKEAQ